MTRDFTDWLLAQRRSDDPVGRLAREVHADPDWPKGASLNDLHAHLRERGADDAGHATLARAWLEWEGAGYPRGAP
jgi:uncharacterized protein YozE (UPF0346 family)